MKKLFAAAALVLAAICIAGCAGSKATEPVPVRYTQAPQITAAPGETAEKKHEAKEDDTRKRTPEPSAGAGQNDIGSDLKKTVLTVKSEDCYEGYGFYMFVAEHDADYTVEMFDGGAGVEWEVYILPDKFEDAERYIPNSYSPVLTESGTVHVEKNNYVYVHCSVNSFTSESPAAGATVTITGYGVPKD